MRQNCDVAGIIVVDVIVVSVIRLQGRAIGGASGMIWAGHSDRLSDKILSRSRQFRRGPWLQKNISDSLLYIYLLKIAGLINKIIYYYLLYTISYMFGTKYSQVESHVLSKAYFS